MGILYFMVGIPASGKTTKAAELIRKGAVAVSTDTVREEIFGDANIQYTDDWLAKEGYDGPDEIRAKAHFANARIFDAAYRKCTEKLKEGLDVIFDTTACSKMARKLAMDNISHADKTICFVMAVPLGVCCERNKARNRTVDDEAMKRISDNFELPSEAEGFDEIVYIGDRNDIDYGVAVSEKTCVDTLRTA